MKENTNINSIIQTVMNELSNYGSNFKNTVKELLHKGIAYNQVKWERDIAIRQLQDLGIGFGENTDKYRIAIKNINKMQRENVMYSTCNTEWGLDARYICPDCLQPVEKGNNFCHNCGKAISWYNAPKPTKEMKNRMIANAKSGTRLYLRSTSATHYYVRGRVKQENVNDECEEIKLSPEMVRQGSKVRYAETEKRI